MICTGIVGDVKKQDMLRTYYLVKSSSKVKAQKLGGADLVTYFADSIHVTDNPRLPGPDTLQRIGVWRSHHGPPLPSAWQSVRACVCRSWQQRSSQG